MDESAIRCNLQDPEIRLKSRFESEIRERYFQNPPIRLSVRPPLYAV